SEVRIGVIPAMISVVVVRKLGAHHAMRLFLTGARFDAREALGYGLLHGGVAGGGREAAIEAEAAQIAPGGRDAGGRPQRVEPAGAAAASAQRERKPGAGGLGGEAAEGGPESVARLPRGWAPP